MWRHSHEEGKKKCTHLIGIVVGCCNFNGSWQVEDDGVFFAGIDAFEPSVLDGVADLDGELRLGLGEGLGGVFELPLGLVTAGSGFVDELADKLDVLDGEFDGLLL